VIASKEKSSIFIKVEGQSSFKSCLWNDKNEESFLYFWVFVLESIKIDRLFLVSLLKSKVALEASGYFGRVWIIVDDFLGSRLSNKGIERDARCARAPHASRYTL